MKVRSELVHLVTLVAFLLHPMVLAAQAPTADPACACFAPSPAPPEGDEDDEEDSESPPPGSRTNIGLIGVAGLVALAGIPFGGAVVQGLPFAQGAAPPAAVPAVESVSELAPTTESQVAAAPPVEARRPTAAPAPRQIADLPLTPGVGVVPPKTATHLPLMLALGLALVGGGGVLARRERRRKKRRRRILP